MGSRWRLSLVKVVVLAGLVGCSGDDDSTAEDEEPPSLSTAAPCTDWLAAPSVARVATGERMLEVMGSADPQGNSSAFAREVTVACEGQPDRDVAEVGSTVYVLMGEP